MPEGTQQEKNAAETTINQRAEEKNLPPDKEKASLEEEEQEKKWGRIKAFRGEAYRKARADDITGAIEVLLRGLDFDPKNEMMARDLSHLYAVRGWEQYKKKDYQKARGFFEEGLYYWPENPEAMRGLAYVFFQKRDREKAEAWLRSYIEVGADRPDIYSLLGRICYDSDRLEEAIYYFKLSLIFSPEQPEVKQMLDKITREAEVEAEFDQAETSHFTIKYEGRKLPEVKTVVEVICEEAYIVVGRRLGYFPDIPLTVILYTDEQFLDVTRSPAWAGAIFDGKIRIPAKGLRQRTEVLERIVFHEYTHAVVHEVSQGRAPVWLQEGLAQLNEGQPFETEALAARLTARGGPAPLRQLEGSFMALSGNQAQLAYLESLLAIQYLESEYGPFARRQLLRYLSEGNKIAKAIEELTYRSYDRFDSDFKQWVELMAETGN